MAAPQHPQHPWFLPLVIGAALLSNLLNPTQAGAQANTGVQELTQGPLHEAFGQPVVFDPQPGVVVAKKPPDPIEEMPPEEKPQGDNVFWISGYWYWDDQRQDFIWLSGFWRTSPPGRMWVPGYWSTTDGSNYQWVSGFWASMETREAEYLPQPPESSETGPSTAPPSPDTIWTPGCWIWQQTRFLWRPGHWIVANPDWVWVPAHYEWTPRGYVFVGGFWDYPIVRRGLLFAPVVVDPRVLAQPSFLYTPAVVLNTQVLTNYLFTRPAYQHYYFGDYYADTYLKAGVYPWFAFHNSRLGYDPLFAHAAWKHGRQDPRWTTTLRDQYWDRREHEAARPPHTFAALQGAVRQAKTPSQVQQLTLARSLTEVARQKNPPVPLQRVEPQGLKAFQQSAREAQVVTQDRARWEGRKTTVPKVEAKAIPKVEAKVPPQVEPKALPKVEPKVPPKVEPKVEPKVLPKVEPKVPPKVEPKVEPKVPPKVEAKVPPKIEPKALPKEPARTPPPAQVNAPAKWQMPKTTASIPQPKIQAKAPPALPQTPPHHVEPPKRGQPLPGPEDLLKGAHVQEKSKAPPPKPKG